MKLFDPSHRYTYAANEVAERIHNAVEPIMDEFKKRGASPREIELIAHHEITDIAVSQVLDLDTHTEGTKGEEKCT